jgi:hypothetical protein
MRLLYRRKSYHQLESEMELLEHVLCSKTYIFLDLFFISVMISLAICLTFKSLLLGTVVFFAFYTAFFVIYYLLSKWLKDSPAEE